MLHHSPPTYFPDGIVGILRFPATRWSSGRNETTLHRNSPLQEKYKVSSVGFAGRYVEEARIRVDIDRCGGEQTARAGGRLCGETASDMP